MRAYLFALLFLLACGDPGVQDHDVSQNASNAVVLEPAKPINHPVACDGDICTQPKVSK
jgi:hypothetical protein